MDKEILAFVSSIELDDDVVDTYHYVFYTNGTYTYSDWNEGEFSLWKFVDGKLYVKHPRERNAKWIAMDYYLEPIEVHLVNRIKVELAIRKMLA